MRKGYTKVNIKFYEQVSVYTTTFSAGHKSPIAPILAAQVLITITFIFSDSLKLNDNYVCFSYALEELGCRRLATCGRLTAIKHAN